MQFKLRNKNLKDIAVLLLALNIIFTFLNNNEYLLLSGFYIFLIPSIGIGIIAICSNKIIKINYGFTCSLILLLLTLFGGIQAGVHLSTGVLYSFVLIFLEACELFILDIDEHDIDFLLNSVKYSSLIFAVLMFITRVDYWGGGWRYSVQLGNGPIIDPNYLGTVFSSGLAISIYLMFKNKDVSRIRNFNLLTGLICLICIFFSGSRGAMLASAFSGMFSVIHIIHGKIRTKKEIIRNIFLFAIIFLTICFVITHLPKNVFKRLFVLSYQDGSNFRRIFLWKNAFGEIKKHVLLGVGCIEEIVSIGTPAHNSFLSLWLDLGGIGLISLLVMIIKPTFLMTVESQVLH